MAQNTAMEKGIIISGARWLGLLAGVLLVGACTTSAPKQVTPATTTDTAPTASAPNRTLNEGNPPTPPPLSEDVLLTGFSAISGKYIEAVTIAQLATESLRGMAAIDPTITIQADPDHITLYRDGALLATQARPPQDNVKAWTRLTTTLVDTARVHSPEMTEASDERVFEALFDASLSELDIFSRYAGADEARRNRAKRDGFGGIGLHFRKEGSGLLITKVITKTPADDAGLEDGDIIVEIDGITTRDMTARLASHVLRGPILSEITLVVERPRDGTPRRLTLKRAHIIPDTVTVRVEDGLLHFKVKGFNGKTADVLRAHLEAAHTPGAPPVKGIILDLRGNPGGLLRQSIQVADLFLAKGLIMSTNGRHPDSGQIYRANGKDISGGLPLAVIVDGKSASAAEVVAAALQDQGRAVIIGATSYGKGTVQTVIRLPNDGEITLTWSRLIAPSGYAFHGLGVPPAICTSRTGASGDASGEHLIRKTFKAETSLIGMMRAWRQIGHEGPVEASNSKRRHSLRARCPSERLYAVNMPEVGQRDRETRVATRLLGNPDLYARALALTRPLGETAALTP